jgi:Bacterial protein of unknown function (DUF922)
MADRIPGVSGTDPHSKADWPPGSGFTDPGPGGMDAPIPMMDRLIAQVDDDWHPPAPDTSAEVTVQGQTLADVGAALKSLDEWGRGGGALRADPIPIGTSTNLTVTLHGNLVRRLAVWADYSSASAAAKREWDRMVEKLKAHEQRHMEIAIEHGDALAKELIGKDISRIAPMVTARNALMAKDQKKLDDATDHGAKKGVPYGDVYLDTSVP